MTTKVILYFPSDATDKAVTYDLVKRYDLRINILRAEIEAGRSGSLLVELTGEEPMVREGVAYLERNGVTVSPVASKIAYDRDRCIDCGNCALACFPQALTIGARGGHRRGADAFLQLAGQEPVREFRNRTLGYL